MIYKDPHLSIILNNNTINKNMAGIDKGKNLQVNKVREVAKDRILKEKLEKIN
jgi:hypothetical protein